MLLAVVCVAASERALPSYRQHHLPQLAERLPLQLYVGLDFFPKTPPAFIDWKSTPPTMPTVAGSLESLQDSLKKTVSKRKTGRKEAEVA